MPERICIDEQEYSMGRHKLYSYEYSDGDIEAVLTPGTPGDIANMLKAKALTFRPARRLAI